MSLSTAANSFFYTFAKKIEENGITKRPNNAFKHSQHETS